MILNHGVSLILWKPTSAWFQHVPITNVDSLKEWTSCLWKQCTEMCGWRTPAEKYKLPWSHLSTASLSLCLHPRLSSGGITLTLGSQRPPSPRAKPEDIEQGYPSMCPTSPQQCTKWTHSSPFPSWLPQLLPKMWFFHFFPWGYRHLWEFDEKYSL